MNKKGMTLVEIIISIVLISIVLIFLFSLLITVKDINDESEVNSTYLINKSLILKNIEEDLSEATSVKIDTCNINDIYSSYDNKDKDGDTLTSDLQANKCIKFIYNGDDNNVGYLGIYYYKNKDSYVISYIHDDVKATRVLPDYESVPKNIEVDNNNIIKTWTLNGGTISSIELTGFNVINIPIIGIDGKDYGINISYYKKPTTP